MSGRKISFDGWTLDRESGDLTRNGTRQRLQELPLKVLDLLIADPGAVVTREQLIAHLWPNGVVEYDTGLNTAIRKLRLALGDVADTPRYIETLPRRGYRFIGTIDRGVESSSDRTAAVQSEVVDSLVVAAGVPDAMPSTAAAPDPRPGKRVPVRLLVTIFGGIAVIVIAAAMLYGRLHRTSVVVTRQPDHQASVVLAGRTVAVLPFANLSPSGDDAILALGMAETVMHRLGAMKDLTVISRTSSFVFNDNKADVRDIGQKLNARYIVEGSVQHAGERLRVTAELIDATSGARRWSLSFDRKLADIFALEDEISDKITDALSVSVKSDHGTDPTERTSRVDAYMAYMQGRSLIDTSKVADLEAAIQRFARATEIDPRFAAAYAQQSRAITRLLVMRETEGDSAGIARAASLNDQALSLDPSLGEAWVQRAILRIMQKQDTAVIDQDYRKGLALAPNYGPGFMEFAEFLFSQGKVEESLRTIDRARQLDPLAPRSHYMKGLFLMNSHGEDRQIRALMQQALNVNPNYFPALTRLGQIYANDDERTANGIELMERALTIDPEATWIREVLATEYLHIGEGAAAQDVLQAEGGDIRGVQACVLVLQGNEQGAAQFAYAFLSVPHPGTFPTSEICAAAAIRNEAIRTGQYDRAIRVLQGQYAQHVGSLEEDEAVRFSVVWGLPYAETLLAKGEQARGTQLARAILAEVDRVIDHPDIQPLSRYWRARALAVLGERSEAMAALESAVAHGFTFRLWMFDHEPSIVALRGDPRYQPMFARVKQQDDAQRAVLAELRKAHRVPQRPMSW